MLKNGVLGKQRAWRRREGGVAFGSASLSKVGRRRGLYRCGLYGRGLYGRGLYPLKVKIEHQV